MLLSFLLIGLIAASGFALTYLIESDEPFMWRLAAGNVIGCALYGTLSFVIACVFGLRALIAAIPLMLMLSPLAVFMGKQTRAHAWHDWQRAKGKLQGATFRKFLTFSYYVFFFVVFWLFFEWAMIETSEGIFTGGSHNLGDLPFHLGAIFSFADGNNFPPQNPSFAGAKFSYPFIADVITAGFMKFGAGVREAMFAQNFSWALSLLVILDRFVVRLTGEKSAGKIAAFLLFFSGGLGFIWFFSDFREQASGFWEFLSHLPKDYTINDDDGLSWGNSLTALFITQRSLLLGMPLALIVLGFLWKTFVTSAADEAAEAKGIDSKEDLQQAALVGLLAGCLPLIHLHSLAVLFVVTAFLFLLKPDRWRVFLSFGVGVCLVAVPELIWSITGSASKTSEFFGWHFGWDVKEGNFLWFWIKNTGFAIPILIGGILLVYLGKANDRREKSKHDTEVRSSKEMLLFYLPFLFCFVLANVAKMAPWEWDNIKVLIYWFVGSLPLITMALLWAWRQSIAAKICVAICFLTLIAAGSLDVWRTVSGQIRNKVFDSQAIQVAERIKKITPPNAVFLNAPTYNTPVVLSGRLSLMRFPGHLWSHGIDYAQREQDVKSIYAGTARSDELLQKYNVDYVMISPDEKGALTVNEGYFRKFPLIAEVGQYRVFKIR